MAIQYRIAVGRDDFHYFIDCFDYWPLGKRLLDLI